MSPRVAYAAFMLLAAAVFLLARRCLPRSAALAIRVKTGDTFALPLALALALGRWGCFCNGCCFGKPTDLPWGVDFGDGVRCHPTQIYESLFHALMALVLLELMRRGLFR